jgi:hypothetical protein
MIPSQPTRSSNADRRASEDLRQAVGQQQLAEIVRDAVPSRPIPAQASDSSERLLALLTYSYAAGIYNSAEIPGEFDQEDVLRLLGTPLPSDHHVLRNFRRHNRSELHECLSQVLRRARATTSPSREHDPSADAEWSTSRWSLNGNHDFSAEAEERINRAIRTDTFALDD